MEPSGSARRRQNSSRSAIDDVARQVAAVVGQEFFSTLARHLAAALSADCVYVGEFAGGEVLSDLPRVKTLAAWMHGSDNASFDYQLYGSIAEEIALAKPCSYRRDARVLFPEDALLQEVAAEACVGVPLATPEGRQIGALFAMYRERLVDAGFTRSLLASVAPRASAELVRKHTEDALRESEQRYRAFIAQSSDAMWRIEFERPIPLDLPEDDQIDCLYEFGYVAECNDAAAALAGVATAEEWVGSRFGDIAPRDNAQIQEQIKSAVRLKYRYSVMQRTVQNSEGKEEYRIRTQWGIIDEGLLYRIWFTSRDVTEFRRTQMALRASEERFDTFLDSMHLFAAVLNPDGVIKSCNDYLVRWTGWSEEDLVGKLWFDVLTPPEMRESQMAAFSSTLETGGAEGHYEGMLMKRSGERMVVYWDTSVLRDYSGRISGVAAVGRDISRIRLLEEQLARVQRVESLGRLAGGVAGHLHGLLTTLLMGAAGLIGGLEKEHPGYPYLRDIVDAAKTASLLTHRLVAFSRGENLDLAPIHLNVLLVEAESTVRALLNPGVNFTVELDPTLRTVNADAGWITQILAHVVLNARDAMPNGGVLTIRTANVMIGSTQVYPSAEVPPGEYVHLAISDTGAGMTPEVQAHAFDPGFTTKGPGRGFGLSTVYGIVTQSGGFVWVGTVPNNGTTVNLLFPCTSAERSDDASSSKTPRAQGGETILVLDEHDESRTLISAVLRQFGYRVLGAADGSRAITAARQNTGPIHLVITDIMLRDEVRADLVKELRTINAGIQVLCVSPFSVVPLAPGESHIQMPFTTEALAQKVREVLHGPRV